MTPFAHKTLITALASASILALPEANAVRVNPSGLGQYLIYPYYTVRSDSKGNAFVTGMSVVNATTSVKAVKVRFLEGKAAAEVLNFNLYLSPNDVWTGAVVPTATGAQLISFDNSCTVPGLVPDIPINPGAPFLGRISFSNANYVNDPAGGSLDRTREGYFEIIEMGVVTNVTVANAATHNYVGIPNNCAVVRSDTDSQGVGPPTGGLFGGESFINVMAGTDYTADPVALDDFSNVGQWCQPGCPTPNASTVSPPLSVVSTSNANGQEQIISTGGTNGWGAAAPGSVVDNVSAVSAVLMHESIYNEFVLEAFTQSGTDWIVTFPTKRFYYTAVDSSVSQVSALFQRNFVSSGACDDTGYLVLDREEKFGYSMFQAIGGQEGVVPLCWAAHVLTFDGTNVFGSSNSTNYGTTNSSGWLRLRIAKASGFNIFPDHGLSAVPLNHMLFSSGATTIVLTPATVSMVTNHSATYFGLPVIGFAVNSYLNGTLIVNGQRTLSAYGGNFVHKFTEHIQTP